MWSGFEMSPFKVNDSSNENSPTAAASMEMFSNPEHCDAFFQNLNDMRVAELLVDSTIVLEGVIHKVHLLVLSCVSQLACQWMENEGSNVMISDMNGTKTIKLDGITSQNGLKALIKFAYTGEIDHMEPTQILEALSNLKMDHLAQLYRLKTKSSEIKMSTPIASMERQENMKKMKMFWERGIGCDVKLQVNEKFFEAHRIALAAGADFFHAMFSSGMKESQQSIVKLTSLSSSTLSTILNFIYSGTISLSWDNIFEVMEAVLQYQVVSALPLCTKFIQKEINDEYCLDCLLLAEAFNLTDLMNYVEQYILNNFRKVSLLPKFQDLSAEKLANLLENDGLCVSTEMEVFWSVLHWIEEDKNARTELAPKVMKSVRFPLLSPKELKEVWATEIMRDNLACKSILESSLSCSKYNLGNKGVMCKARTPGQVLVFIGGDHLNNDYSKRLPSKMLWFANRFLTDADNRNSTEWHPLSSIPDLPRFRHAVAVFNNQLYVFGGSRYYGQRDILKSVKRYDPDEDSWEDLPDMNECRNYFPVVCVNGVMYALGGNVDDFHCLSSVECYTLGDSAWRFVEPLDIPLCGHAAATWDKEIYISGGCDNKYNCTKNVFQYNALKGCIPQSSMWSERGGHVMQVIGDRFYVAGGLRQSCIGYTDQYLCECYNPLEDTWTAIASLPRPHVSPASAVLDSKLYILGGFCAETYKDCHLMHCYDLLTNRWICMGALPEAFADVAACVLVIPARLKQ